MSKTFLFQAIQFSQKILIQTIQFSISIDFVYTQWNVKIVLFQAIQFSISMQFTSIWPIEGTLSGPTTLGKSGSGSNGNKGVLHIPQSSSITGTSPSDSLMPYPGHRLGNLTICRDAVGVFYSPSNWVRIKLLVIHRNTWNHLTVCKQMSNVELNY